MECPVNIANDPTPKSTATSSTTASASSKEDIDRSKLVEIPQPPQQYFGLLGHMPDIDPGFPIRSFWNLMDMYGPIFNVNLGGSRIVVGNQALISELFDEEKWKKVPGKPQIEMRAASGDGLFTAFLEEKNWWKAHRLLLPAFGMSVQFLFCQYGAMDKTKLMSVQDHLGS
jgi:cytochrome P450/NADPH-cytochrome P450 reductase